MTPFSLNKVGLFLGLAIYSVTAWSGSHPKRFDGIDRRRAIETISSVLAAPLVSTGLNPGIASANDAVGTDSSTFEAYNIIPDASPSLNPRLEKVDNSMFLSQLSAPKTGGSIWLGEHHNAKRDHDFQANFIRMLHQERMKRGIKEPMAVGLEQVQDQFQPALDDYIDGKIGLKDMRKRVEWDKRWMWDFEGYKNIFEAAKDLNIKLVALNVDSEDLAKVENGGYPGLPNDRLRKYIKDPVGFGEFAKARQFSAYVNYVISPSYELHQRLGLLRYSMSGEKLDEEMSFRNFLSGRILWDEGMASSAHSWVLKNPGGLLVGLVGADHVKFGNGIPGRFARMAREDWDCTAVVINPTLVDSRPAGSVVSVSGSDSSSDPDSITLQLRYLKDGVDPASEARRLPGSTGGVLPFSDYIVVA